MGPLNKYYKLRCIEMWQIEKHNTNGVYTSIAVEYFPRIIWTYFGKEHQITQSLKFYKQT